MQKHREKEQEKDIMMKEEMPKVQIARNEYKSLTYKLAWLRVLFDSNNWEVSYEIMKAETRICQIDNEFEEKFTKDLNKEVTKLAAQANPRAQMVVREFMKQELKKHNPNYYDELRVYKINGMIVHSLNDRYKDYAEMRGYTNSHDAFETSVVKDQYLRQKNLNYSEIDKDLIRFYNAKIESENWEAAHDILKSGMDIRQINKELWEVSTQGLDKKVRELDKKVIAKKFMIDQFENGNFEYKSWPDLYKNHFKQPGLYKHYLDQNLDQMVLEDFNVDSEKDPNKEFYVNTMGD